MSIRSPPVPITRSLESSSVGSGPVSVPKADSKTSYEEINVVNYDQEIVEGEEVEKEKLQPKTGEYYYQDYKYVIPTQSDFDRKQVQDSKLFDKTKKVVRLLDEEKLKDEEPCRDASILVTGFGMRDVKSFQELMSMSQEQRRKWELRKLWRDQKVKEGKELAKEKKERVEVEEATARTDTTEVSTSTSSSKRSSSDFLSQTETVTKTEISDEKKSLDYLLGLESDGEESPEYEEEEMEEQSEIEFKYSSSKSIREAQRYLRVHRIFECFQFITAHLLSANAENPIEFILNLLNQCLLYRTGLGEPPLLYERKHISQLCHLMDRLQSGFIDFPQYKTGMKSLGICTFNENPVTNDEDLISKETFIEEAYEAELAIFNELIKRRREKAKKKEKLVPSIFESVSIPSLNPPLFIPSDLFKVERRTQDYSDG